MTRTELEALQRVEQEHWFYKGKRELVSHWVRKLMGVPSAGTTMLDAGAGTGLLVRELRREFPQCSVVGIEYSKDGRDIAKEHYGIELQAGSILELPPPDNSVDAAIALDVLEHVERDDVAFSELLRITKPGGFVIINVPAMQSLWSDWDVSLGHFRRYSMTSFRELLDQANSNGRPFKIHYLQYINAFAFPLILGYRLVRKFFPSESRAEDVVPSRTVNAILKAGFVEPAKATWFKPPFGVSLFCVLQKGR